MLARFIAVVVVATTAASAREILNTIPVTITAKGDVLGCISHIGQDRAALRKRLAYARRQWHTNLVTLTVENLAPARTVKMVRDELAREGLNVIPADPRYPPCLY
jgi:hypothetical protein